MPAANTDATHPSISDQIMKDKHFEFRKVSVEEVKKILLSINNDKPPGSGNLDGKLLRIIANDIATPICQIFDLSILECVCPQCWWEAKVITLPKNSKAPFTGSNSQPISLLPTISKLLAKIVFDQIQCYFTVNQLTTNFQHAYREGHSTSTVLTQMTDDSMREIDDKKIVGAVLLDFSAAFDIIDQCLLLEKCMC